MKAFEPVLVLTLGTDRLIPEFDLSEQDESNPASMEQAKQASIM